MANDKETRDILAYIQGLLPNARRVAFEARLQSDTALQEKVARYKQTVTGLRHMAALERMRQVQNVTEQKPLPIVRPLWQTPQFIGSLAASIALLLIIGAGLYRTYFSPARQAFDTYYRPDNGFRGAEANCEAITDIIQLYQKEQYEQALQKINQRSDASTPCVRYEKGLIQLALGEPEAAIALFEQMGQLNDKLLSQKRNWYLSLAYLRNNQPNEARRLLNQIITSDNHPFARTAQRVLERLNP
ncbi:hypothetical protein GCM10028807_23700 [Spirosoma daeguense]